jgi:gluconolactonase
MKLRDERIFQPVKIAEGFEFCEGPAFARDGSLWLVNVDGGYVSRVSMNGEITFVANTGGGPNGGQFDRYGNFIVCECRRRAIVAVSPKGEVSPLLDSYEGHPLNGPNDIAIDADGSFFFTDPEGSSLDKRIGAVYHCSPGGTISRVADGLAYPNGIVINAERTGIYLAETRTQQIHRYIRKSDGSLGPRTLFCQLEQRSIGGPDGMCLDQLGNLYIAMYGYSCIQVVDAAGNALHRLATPGANPTNCCFGPPHSEFATSLFVTETITNAIWRYEVGIAGMPLHAMVASITGGAPLSNAETRHSL